MVDVWSSWVNNRLVVLDWCWSNDEGLGCRGWDVEKKKSKNEKLDENENVVYFLIES